MCRSAQNDGCAAQTNPTPDPTLSLTLTPTLTPTLWGARGLLSRSVGAVLSLRAILKTLHVRAIKRLVLDTLYEPNAVFSQFLGSASRVTFFFPFSFSCFLFLSCLFLLFFFLLFFPFLFRFLFSLSFLFAFLSFLFLFVLRFFFPIDLRLSCVWVVIDTTCNIYVVVFLGWQAV